jgi:hypothetical protein
VLDLRAVRLMISFDQTNEKQRLYGSLYHVKVIERVPIGRLDSLICHRSFSYLSAMSLLIAFAKDTRTSPAKISLAMSSITTIVDRYFDSC